MQAGCCLKKKQVSPKTNETQAKRENKNNKKKRKD